jgi:arabinogalactan oligomer/maltooligosaccharide transport system substrate-binding protein
MKYSKFVFGLLIVLLALGSFGFVLAQDQLPAVQLVQWTTEKEEPLQKAMADLFNQWAEKNAPGSTLEIVYKETETERNDLQTAGLAGSGMPDMVVGPNDPIGIYVDAGIVLPLDDLFDMSLYPTNIGAAQVAGQTYAVPIFSGNHLMLLYNKQFVEKAPDTWEELVAVAKDVEAKNPDVQGFEYNQVEPFWFLPIVMGFGGAPWDREGNFTMDTQAWVDAYQFVHDLKFKDEILPSECDYDCADGQFKEGSVAMIINGDWSLNGYLDTTSAPALGKDNLGIAPWPKLPNGERPKPYTAGRFVSIPVTVEGDKLNAVVSFLTWLTTDPEAVKAISVDLGRLPAIEAVKVDPKTDPILAASLDVLATGVGMPADPKLRCMWDSVRPNLEGVMADSVTPADAAAEGQISAEDCAAK